MTPMKLIAYFTINSDRLLPIFIKNKIINRIYDIP